MCFVHKHMQNADFGQILCRRASTKRHVTSRLMVRFSQTSYQKMRKTWKKKTNEKVCRDLRRSRGSRGFRTGGGGGSNWPLPVKIGLKGKLIFGNGSALEWAMYTKTTLRMEIRLKKDTIILEIWQFWCLASKTTLIPRFRAQAW